MKAHSASPHPHFTAAIPAAGAGTRFGSGTPKQYLEIAGRAMLLRTVDAFAALAECDAVVIAADDSDRARALVAGHPAAARIAVVPGGAERQDSVAAALDGLPDGTLVLVHDAARPLVSAAEIRAVAAAVQSTGAAVLALPVRDTLKRVRGARVAGTVDRTELWAALTPQGARAGLLRDAIAAARRDGAVATDESALLERLGVSVAVVRGSAANLKITEPSDVALAEAILLVRERVP